MALLANMLLQHIIEMDVDGVPQLVKDNGELALPPNAASNIPCLLNYFVHYSSKFFVIANAATAVVHCIPLFITSALTDSLPA